MVQILAHQPASLGFQVRLHLGGEEQDRAQPTEIFAVETLERQPFHQAHELEASESSWVLEKAAELRRDLRGKDHVTLHLADPSQRRSPEPAADIPKRHVDGQRHIHSSMAVSQLREAPAPAGGGLHRPGAVGNALIHPSPTADTIPTLLAGWQFPSRN